MLSKKMETVSIKKNSEYCNKGEPRKKKAELNSEGFLSECQYIYMLMRMIHRK